MNKHYQWVTTKTHTNSLNFIFFHFRCACTNITTSFVVFVYYWLCDFFLYDIYFTTMTACMVGVEYFISSIRIELKISFVEFFRFYNNNHTLSIFHTLLYFILIILEVKVYRWQWIIDDRMVYGYAQLFGDCDAKTIQGGAVNSNTIGWFLMAMSRFIFCRNFAKYVYNVYILYYYVTTLSSLLTEDVSFIQRSVTIPYKCT